MLFRLPHSSDRFGVDDCNVSDVIQQELNNTHDNAQALSRLIEIVKALAKALPENLQEEFVAQLDAGWLPQRSNW